ncbi:MAG: pilus assembly protein PilM [Oscillospiraceae bacterium]|nr:pilus assembly protein PilM [Oscillospiraceae bacterium]
MKHINSAVPKRYGQKNVSGQTIRKNNTKKYLGKPLLSIDIGQHAAKIVMGRVVKPTLIEVRRAISFPTPRGSMEKGRILDLSELSQQIRNFVGSEKPSYVLCTMENSEIITREIIIPTASETEMENMLQFEVQQYMPVDLENYIIQSKLLDSFQDGGANKTRFLSTAVPKDLVQSYYDLMLRANLKPDVLDIQSNSIDKLISAEIAASPNSAIPADAAVAILDFGYNHINVVLIENGRYQFNRYIDQGSESINRGLMSVFDYTAEESEQRKRDVIDLSTSLSVTSEPSQDSERITLREVNIVKNIIDNWADEFERVFKYYTSRNTEKDVKKILIHGGVTQIKGFGAYLSKIMGIPVEQIQKLNCVKVQDSSVSSITSYLNTIGAFIRR